MWWRAKGGGFVWWRTRLCNGAQPVRLAGERAGAYEKVRGRFREGADRAGPSLRVPAPAQVLQWWLREDMYSERHCAAVRYSTGSHDHASSLLSTFSRIERTVAWRQTAAGRAASEAAAVRPCSEAAAAARAAVEGARGEGGCGEAAGEREAAAKDERQQSNGSRGACGDRRGHAPGTSRPALRP